jgi:hypothetical protein
MEPSDQITNQEKKIKELEQDLNDLRQGLTLVRDYYRALEPVSLQQDPFDAVDEQVTRQLMDEDIEFEGIWKFHEEVLVPDPAARVPLGEMYEAFVQYCARNGRNVVDQNAFEFVFERLENPKPELTRGEWIGYRLRQDLG